MVHGEAAAAVRKLTFVSGSHTIFCFSFFAWFFFFSPSLFSALLLVLCLDESLQEKEPLCRSIMCVLCAPRCRVLDVFVSLCLCEWHMRQRDKTVRTEDRETAMVHDHSAPLATFLPAHHCHIAPHHC